MLRCSLRRFKPNNTNNSDIHIMVSINNTTNKHHLCYTVDSGRLMSMKISNNSKLSIKQEDTETFTIRVRKDNNRVRITIINCNKNIRANTRQRLFIPRQRTLCLTPLRKANCDLSRPVNAVNLRILIKKRNRDYNSVIHRQSYSFNSSADRLLRRE